jgi:hypothetical protein
MLYKDYKISVWTSEWVKKRISEANCSFDGWRFCGIKEAVEKHEYVALAWHVESLRLLDINGGSTPVSALNLAKYGIDLLECYKEQNSTIGQA